LKEFVVVYAQYNANLTIGIARGGPEGPWPPKFLENIVILCFERRFSKQNSVIRLKHIGKPILKKSGEWHKNRNERENMYTNKPK